MKNTELWLPLAQGHRDAFFFNKIRATSAPAQDEKKLGPHPARAADLVGSFRKSGLYGFGSSEESAFCFAFIAS